MGCRCCNGLCLLAIVCCLGFMAFTACAPGGATVSDQGEPAAPAVATGDSVTAPEFTLRTLSGDDLSLTDTNGEIRLIDFWATWCAPCREEVPMLNELQASYADRGFRIIAISDEEEDAIREFVADYEVAYMNLVGTEEVIEAYGVLGLPAAYLLDGDGRVVESFMGPKPRKVLVEKIEALLASHPST